MGKGRFSQIIVRSGMNEFTQAAIRKAGVVWKKESIPVGAVPVHRYEIIGPGQNRRQSL